MNIISRRNFLKVSLGYTGLSVLENCSSPQETLSIAAGIWQGYEPLFLASREGWLDPNRVRLREMPSNSSSFHALTSGIVQGAALTLDEVLRIRDGGLPVSIVLVFDISDGADMLLARPPNKSVADLKGKRIGVEQAANAALILAKALQSAGLTAADVEQVPLAIGDHLDAWHQDKVDALVTYEPAASQLMIEGAQRVFDTKQIPNTIVDVLAFNRAALDGTFLPAIEHLVAAHFRALHFIRDQPNQAALRMARHLNLPDSQVINSYVGLKLPGIDENKQLLSGDRPLLLDTARQVGDFMRQARLLNGQDDYANLIASQFVAKAGA